MCHTQVGGPAPPSQKQGDFLLSLDHTRGKAVLPPTSGEQNTFRPGPTQSDASLPGRPPPPRVWEQGQSRPSVPEPARQPRITSQGHVTSPQNTSPALRL